MLFIICSLTITSTTRMGGGKEAIEKRIECKLHHQTQKESLRILSG